MAASDQRMSLVKHEVGSAGLAAVKTRACAGTILNSLSIIISLALPLFGEQRGRE
jgi:hypothetical protein